MIYKLVNGSECVIRIADGASIPPDPRNADWREYQAWLTAGNTPDPADPIPPPTVLYLSGATFLSRLTDAEYAAIADEAAKHPLHARWFEMLRMTNRIDLLSALVVAAKAYQVSKGVLTSGRANIIFAPP